MCRIKQDRINEKFRHNIYIKQKEGRNKNKIKMNNK